MKDNSHIALGYLIGCMEAHIKQDIPYTVERMREALKYVKTEFLDTELSGVEIDLLTQQELS